MHMIFTLLLVAVSLFSGDAGGTEGQGDQRADRLPGTTLLPTDVDMKGLLLDGADRFLLREIEQSVASRTRFWNRDFSSAEAYDAAIAPNRRRLAQIIGAADSRSACDGFELMQTTLRSSLVGKGIDYEIHAVRWPAFPDVHGEGLLLVPAGKRKLVDIVAVPDADVTPEMLVGLVPGVPEASQYARRLAESGCRVLVPALVSRGSHENPLRNVRMTHREFIYRAAFELGRHPVGYEVQKILAAVDGFAEETQTPDPRVGVVGWGEGGLLALYAGALDPRIDGVCVSGYFGPREAIWQEPLDRNIFGLLAQFGDAELASMVVPRSLIVEAARGPEVVVPPGTGAGPGRLTTPALSEVRREFSRAVGLVKGFAGPSRLTLVESGDGFGPYVTAGTLLTFLERLAPGASLSIVGSVPAATGPGIDPQARLGRLVYELDRHNQHLLGESPHVRQEFMKKLDTASLDKYRESVEWYRNFFYEEVIGRHPYRLSSPRVRTRKAYQGEKWNGYEVVMDVLPDVAACGIMLVPKDIRPGERRPAVVCQHGLSGEPRRLFQGNTEGYHDYASRLADCGLVIFMPQDLYIGPMGDRFRTLQRKSNPLGRTLYSLVVPQHRQIVNWMAGLPYVDPERIAFYGLSYGGKTAMRVPPLVPRYCAVICSGDFNNWIWKTASSQPYNPYTYVWHSEYEIFEFNLGNTFNHAEMAALIAPRPFMVERGHFDGVAPDEMVGYEFAKVRRLYAGLLKIGDRCEIEWFDGPHTINGKGTFDFLETHLRWSIVSKAR